MIKVAAIATALVGVALGASLIYRQHEARAREIPEVVECHRVTGEDCFIVKVFLPAMSTLDRILDRFLLLGTTTTSIVQSTPVPPRSLPLDGVAKKSASRQDGES